MAFTLSSSAFGDGETIPRSFTCDGENLAPPLVWSDVPDGTQGFALVMDDPDVPGGYTMYGESVIDHDPNFVPYKNRPEVVARRLATDVSQIP